MMQMTVCLLKQSLAETDDDMLLKNRLKNCHSRLKYKRF